MDNLHIWNRVKVVPDTAKKEIKGGRMKGMTDINPVWRLKVLTETFGICGFGWKYEITEQRLENAVGGEIAAFVTINLYVKIDDKWSDAIPGTGGNTFVAKEAAGLRASDECFKMALTDAISVSCKALGIGVDVYFEKDKSKYDRGEETPPKQSQQQTTTNTKGNLSEGQLKRIFAVAKQCGYTKDDMSVWIKVKFGKTSLTSLIKPEDDQLIAAMESKPKQPQAQ